MGRDHLRDEDVVVSYTSGIDKMKASLRRTGGGPNTGQNTRLREDGQPIPSAKAKRRAKARARAAEEKKRKALEGAGTGQTPKKEGD